jgi:hypothetical protein
MPAAEPPGPHRLRVTPANLGTLRARRGCTCLLMITEDGGTQPRSYIACAAHRRTAEDNRAWD